MTVRKRGLFLGKKAFSHDLFFDIFELFLVVVIVLALANFIADVADQTLFEKNYLARDVSILIDAIYAAPGDVAYLYDEKTTAYQFNIAKSKVTVNKDKEQATPNAIYYLFGEEIKKPINVLNTNALQENQKLYFLKDQSGIKVSTLEASQYKKSP